MDYKKVNELKEILEGFEYDLHIDDKYVSLNIKYTAINFRQFVSISDMIQSLKGNSLISQKISQGYSKEDFDKHTSYGMTFFIDVHGDAFRTHGRKPHLFHKDRVWTLIDDYNILMKPREDKSIDTINWPLENADNDTFISEFFKELGKRNKISRNAFKARRKTGITNDKPLFQGTILSDKVYDFIQERRAGRVKFNTNTPKLLFEHDEKDYNLNCNIDNEINKLIKEFDVILNPENERFTDFVKAYKLNYEKTEGSTISFDDVVKERTESIKSVLISKAKEYASDDSRFYNFEEAGRMKGETAEKALYGMQAKHLVSVKKIIDDIENNNKYPSIELLNEKIGDSINYFILLEGLIKSKIQ